MANWAKCRDLLRRYTPVIGVLVVFAALVLFLRQVPWRSIRIALLAADGKWLSVAVALTFVNMVFRAVVLRYLIYSAARVSIFRALRYTVASITGSIIAPFRAGIALRAWLLVHYEGLSLANCVTMFLLEKVGEVAALLAMAVALPWLLPTLPRWAAGSISLLACVVIASAAVLLSAKGSSRFGQRIRDAIVPIARPHSLFMAQAGTFAHWFADAAMVMAVLKSVGAPSSLGIAILVLLAINIAITVPTPANGGTLEIGAVFALHALGVEAAKAIAFAVLYHAAQVLPTLAVGIWDGPMLWRPTLTHARRRGRTADES